MMNELKLDTSKTYYVFNDNTPSDYIKESTYKSHIYSKSKMHILVNNLFFINFIYNNTYNNNNTRKTKSGNKILIIPRYFYVNSTSLPNVYIYYYYNYRLKY